jgi:hypothetical protein
LSRFQPNSKLLRITDAATEPLTLDDAKNFCRVTIDDDDDLVSSFITAARYECERIANRSFINTTWQLTLDYFPPYSARYSSLLPPAIVGGWSDRNYWLNLSEVAIQLPMPPLIEITELTYVDTNGVLQTLDTDPDAELVQISAGTPGMLTPWFGKIFPITQASISAVNITYVAGYGPDASYVPQVVIAAMRFLVAFYYENRAETAMYPEVINSLLDSVYWGGYN